MSKFQFKTQQEKDEALRDIAFLERAATSDAQYRIYAQRRQEIMDTPVNPPAIPKGDWDLD